MRAVLLRAQTAHRHVINALADLEDVPDAGADEALNECDRPTLSFLGLSPEIARASDDDGRSKDAIAPASVADRRANLAHGAASFARSSARLAHERLSFA